LPHETDITCTSFAELSNKKHQIIFDIFVGNENQQRMIIGKEGRNIREVMDKFKLSYAKMYEVEAEPIVSVKIRNAFRNRFRGKEENIVDDEK
jgi:GTPase Era involved in 16S rRNA processing